MTKVNQPIYLGVNIDHVATLRQARGTCYPDPQEAAVMVAEGGGDSITIHLREDRRHIQDADLAALKRHCSLAINLEIAATDEMLAIASHHQPKHVCFVPEKRQELTTEGGLNVKADVSRLKLFVGQLQKLGIDVAMFIDPCYEQVDAVVETGARTIEIHTGTYADSEGKIQQDELNRIISVAAYAKEKALIVNAGHGLHYENVQAIAKIKYITCLNIGHSIVAKAVFSGMKEAVSNMKILMTQAREYC